MDIDKIRALAERGLPVRSADVRALVERYDETREAQAEIDRLRAVNAELVEALDFLSAHARDRVSDAPEWRDDDTVQIVVTIGDLRRARAALAKAEGE
jgi:hypothetical protein